MIGKPRIALLVPWIKSKGGVERMVLNLLQDKKYDIDIFTFMYDKEKTFEKFGDFDIKVIGKAKSSDFFTRGLSLFGALLTSKIPSLESYDAFIISTAGISELAVFRNRHPTTIAISHTPLRAAHTMYGYYSRTGAKNRLVLPIAAKFYRFMEKRAWGRIGYAMVFSDEVRRRLIDYRLIDGNRIFKISPSIDYSRIKAVKSHKKIIFYPSRFITYKRQHLAVEAFRASELPKKGFKLVLGGFPEDKKYFESINSMSSENVIVKGNMTEKELARLYGECYATLFLAVNEDTGLVPLESMAYGKPVIAVNEGGPKEFIQNGRNGMLVEAEPQEIAKAMNKILNKSLYQKLVNGAIRSKRHDEKRMISDFNKAMEKIMAAESEK